MPPLSEEDEIISFMTMGKFVWSVAHQAKFEFIKMNFHVDIMNRYFNTK